MITFDTTLVREYWHLLCHRRELPAKGDYLRFETAAGDIVVFHDGVELVAFDNRCPHRGARLYDGTHGNQAASCKYHGWTHDAGVMLIPERQKYAACELAEARLHRYTLDWCGDFLFVAIAPRLTLDAQLGDAAALLENIAFNIDGRADANAYRFDCAWPLAVENALEPAHIGHVHPQTLAALQLGDGEDRFMGLNSLWEAPIGNARIRRQLLALKRFFAIDHGYEGYASLYLFPFTMLSSTFGYSYALQHFFPAPAQGGPAATQFSSRLLTVPCVDERAAATVAPLLASTVQMNRRVFDEDHEVCKRLPADAWSAEPLRFASTDEARLQHFRAACRQHLAGATRAGEFA